MATQNVNKQPPKGKIKFSINLSEEQKMAKTNILYHPYNFVVGKAGSGKTLLAVQIGLDMFFQRKINQIIITRPTVSNEDNGYLPGSLDEKMEPWLVPIRSNMRKVYNKPAILEKMESDEKIELVSLSHFRGRTFDNACVIVDEFQNLTKQQLSMVLGRLGKGSTMILTGDAQQIDLRHLNDSAIHEVPKVKESKYVYAITLLDNHRHESLDEILRLLQEYS
jgi:phosphate starvation-inducible PhoH-like protein